MIPDGRRSRVTRWLDKYGSFCVSTSSAHGIIDSPPYFRSSRLNDAFHRQLMWRTASSPVSDDQTVIIGAGIIGCATAYYLASSGNTKPQNIHLVEACPELFASASGKAGGFCVSDWFGPATASLGALSFKLHREFADQHNGPHNWGYSRSTATSFVEGVRSNRAGNDWLTEGGSRAQEAGEHIFSSSNGAPGWLTRGQGSTSEIIGEAGAVAQVDPLRLSQCLLRLSMEAGVQLHQPAKPCKAVKNDAGILSAIRIRIADGSLQDLPCSRLLITAGAWTPSVFKILFPSSKLRLGVQPLAGYSLVIKSPRWTSELESKGCHAIFTSMRGGISPEIFSRIGGEIYIAGLNDADLPLPELATDAHVGTSDIAELKRISEKLLGAEGANTTDLEIVREGLCFRPVTRKGTPILAQIPDKQLGIGAKMTGGVFVAAGHGPWGISHSLGTGKVMSEMLEKQQLSADVRWLGLQ